MGFSICCYQGIPELSGYIFKKERRLVQRRDLVPSRFFLFAQRVSQQEVYALFLQCQVNSVGGAGVRQPSRTAGVLLQGLRCVWLDTLRAFGSLAQLQLRGMELASQEVLQREESLSQNIHWTATGQIRNRTIFYSSCFWANHTWKRSSLCVPPLIPCSPLKSHAF